MDWGATIIFVLSILGAIAIAEGDFIIGFFAFLVIFGILVVAKWILHSIFKSGITEPSKNNVKSENENTHIVFGEEHFEHTLDMVMKFLQEYSANRPGEWYHLYISQKQQRIEYSSTYYVYDGYLEFQILLGSWWDGLLYNEPDIEDYMKTIFTFDPKETTFTYSEFGTGNSTCCSFPHDTVNAMLQKYLDNYEAKHPEIHFERQSWGASLHKNP